MTYASLPRDFNAAVHFVERHVREGRADRTALVLPDGRVTYGQLDADVNRAGNALRRMGVRMEDRVVLALPEGRAFVSWFWGAMKLGAVPVPVSPLLGDAEYEYILNDSRAAIVVVSEPLAERIAALRPRLRFLEQLVVAADALAADEPAGLVAAPTTKDDVAFWVYTSGTTGPPKAAVHLHHDMVVCCEAYGRGVLGMGPDDRAFSLAKPCFAYGLGNALYFPCHVGAASVLYPGVPAPAAVFDVVRREQPTLFFAVPTHYARLLRAAEEGMPADFASVRHCVSAGESLPKVLFERWRERFGLEILDGLGSTELCHIVISSRPGQVRPGSTGTVVPGYEARIVDDAGQDLPAGDVGHLLVKAESACVHYWNQHARSQEVIAGEWVRTGDRYMRDDDGYFWYAGRGADLFKVAGLWVSPVEVEHALLAHPAVLEAGVTGAADPNGLVKPLAFVVLAPPHAGGAALEQELHGLLRERLALVKCPRRIVFVPELPKTATGKIHRMRLRELAQDGAPAPGCAAARPSV
jgi:benzoate-CoA ligase family protein